MIEVRPVRSQASVRVAIAAALAGVSAALSADAATEHQRDDRSEGYSRWAIAQGAARYGIAPSPRPGTVIRVRLIGHTSSNAAVDPAIARRVFLRSSAMARSCAEMLVRSGGDVRVVQGVEVAAGLIVAPNGAPSAAQIRVDERSSLNAAQRTTLGACLNRAFLRLSFPSSQSPITVDYRFRYVVD